MAIKKVHIGEKPGDIQFNITAKVGTTSDKLTDGDRGKPLKLAGDSRYVRCVDGDEIEATFMALENHTADGFAVGTVKTAGGYREAIVTAPGWKIGDLVVADVQAANGVYNDTAKFYRPKVKVGAPEQFKWRIVASYSAEGAANAVVTLQLI